MKKLKLITDQNVPIEIEFAGIGVRLASVLIDMAVLGAYSILMFVLFINFLFADFRIFDLESYDLFMFIYVFTIFIPFLLYTPLLEYFTKGQTIGKMMVGIRVTKINGENAKFKDYFTRWLFRPYEAYFLLLGSYGFLLLIISFFIDTLVSIISDNRQRIGDFMANTVVIKMKPNIVYTATDILNHQKKENYIPKYIGITVYNDDDMMLVKNVISRVENYKNEASKNIAIKLAERIATDLDLKEMPEKKLTFLKDVLNDYVVLTR